MQSNENQKKPEETPSAKEVTISLDEYSNLEKRLQELGDIDSCIQNWKEKQNSGVVPETPEPILLLITFLDSLLINNSWKG